MLEDRFPRTYQHKYPRTIVYCPSAYCREYEVTTMDVTTYGVKRKLCEESDPAGQRGVPLIEQRKSILDISMVKLKMAPCKHEPSLRRSVLIFNTLKYIENELKEEGVKLNPASTPCLLPAIESGDDTLDHLPSSGPGVPPASCINAQSAIHSSLPNAYPCQSESPKTHQDLAISSLSAAAAAAASSSSSKNSAILGDISQDCSERTSCESLHSSGSASSSPSSSSSSSSSDSWDSWVSEPKCILDTLLASDRLAVTGLTSFFDLDNSNIGSSGATTASPSSSGSSSSSSNSSSRDDNTNDTSAYSDSAVPSTSRNHEACLADLDLSLLDLDLLSPMPGKLPSLSAEELMTSLPTCGDAFTTLNTFCNPKHEHFSDDLDHIMQVLVGM